MRNKIFNLIILSFTIYSVSCTLTEQNDLPDTAIEGRVIEGNLNTPIAGAKIEVTEYRRTNDVVKSHSYRYKVVDSAVTDAAGKYFLRFRTSNLAVSYKPDLYIDREYYYEYPSQELQVGKLNTNTFLAYKPMVLKARIICADNTYPPLRVYSYSEINSEWTLSRHNLSGTSIDTTIVLKLIPNKKNRLTFNYYNGHTPRFYTETINPALSVDTLKKTFILNVNNFGP